MVQGTLKKPSRSTTSSKKSTPPVLKKGTRVIAPKKHGRVQQEAIRKKLSSAINKDIETKLILKAAAVGGGKKFSIVKTDTKDAAKDSNGKKDERKRQNKSKRLN
ncbi:hypothetical protein G9A89_002829 [Geosiphon pyriformis]|nr:hypothetical protein G9A89_002829 [Geosiphon pyriformis]